MSEISESDTQRLIDGARAAMDGSYSPYSRFAVGAALLADDGRIFTGANVENSSYGLTICAERVALVKAVTEGVRHFQGLALQTSSGRFVTPCGACRQVLAEFCADLLIWISTDEGVRKLSLRELLPLAFSPADLTQ